MTAIVHAIILGLVQGLTEFLPVSSSAHLNVFPWLFNWETISDSFDVALHLGTLIAICIYFFKDWINLVFGGVKQVFKKEKTTEGKLFWYIVAATIPAGILGLLLDKVEAHFVGDNLNLEMWLIAVALIAMGIILYIVDKEAPEDEKIEDMTFKQSFFIGLSQAFAAAFPGVSRSGITMTVARGYKLDRESAARYSFLLSAPMVLAAVLADIKDFTFSVPFFIGILTSFLSGLFVIKVLMDYLKKGSYKAFAIYRIVLGIVIMGVIFIR